MFKTKVSFRESCYCFGQLCLYLGFVLDFVFRIWDFRFADHPRHYQIGTPSAAKPQNYQPRIHLARQSRNQNGLTQRTQRSQRTAELEKEDELLFMTTTTSRIFISIKPEILCESRRPLRLRVDCFFCCTSISHNQLPETWSETLLKKHDVVGL